MRFTESKKRTPWVIFILLIIIVIAGLGLSFCNMNPTPRTVQKTIVFKAD